MKKLLIIALAATATLAQAQLMIVDSGQDRVVLLDQNNGSITNGSLHHRCQQRNDLRFQLAHHGPARQQ